MVSWTGFESTTRKGRGGGGGGVVDRRQGRAEEEVAAGGVGGLGFPFPGGVVGEWGSRIESIWAGSPHFLIYPFSSLSG